MGGEQEELLTVREVAEWLRFDEKTVRQMCDEGELIGAFKARWVWRIPRSSVNEYITRQTAHNQQR